MKRFIDAEYPIPGIKRQRVSEAIYLNDPDGDGVELYRDRPESVWKYREDGSIEMVSLPLDLDDLLNELN